MLFLAHLAPSSTFCVRSRRHLQSDSYHTNVASTHKQTTSRSLIKNWQAEIRKWLGDERLKTYAVSKDLTPEGFTKYSSQVGADAS